MGYGIGLICGLAIVFISVLGGPFRPWWFVGGVVLALVSLALFLVDA